MWQTYGLSYRSSPHVLIVMLAKDIISYPFLHLAALSRSVVVVACSIFDGLLLSLVSTGTDVFA